MRIPSQLGAALSGTATLALLAGCSGGGGSTPATSPAYSQQAIGARSMSMSHQLVTGHSVLKPGMPQFHGGVPGIGFMTEDATKGGSVFVSDAVNVAVDIFSSAGKETGSITANLSEPQGLTTDKAGNLYLANTGDSNILVYAKGYKGTPVTIPDAGQYPVGVAVDADGNIGVTNIISTSDGAGSVSFIAKGAKKPGKAISNASFARVYFDAFDKAGNLFIDGSDSNGDVVVGEIVGGIKGKTIKVLTTSNSIEFPGGIQVNTKDQVVIDDQEGAAAYTYSFKTPKLTLVSTTPLTGASDAVSIALTSTDADLWTADAGLAEAQKFAYPKGGKPAQSIAVPSGANGTAQPIGVAVTPDETP